MEQAAAPGITVLLSSGDGALQAATTSIAADSHTGPSGQRIASTPFNVSVGGDGFPIKSTIGRRTGIDKRLRERPRRVTFPRFPGARTARRLHCPVVEQRAEWIGEHCGRERRSKQLYGKPKWQMGVTGVPNDTPRISRTFPCLQAGV